MDIFFQDPSETPLPPDEVRIRVLRAEPWSDGRRVKVYLEVDPFQKRPNLDGFILNEEGEVVSDISLIETMTRKMEFNMHLREEKSASSYTLRFILYYTSPLPETKPGEQVPMEMPESTEVDRKEISFSVGGKLE
jgi:hypothetical protein